MKQKIVFLITLLTIISFNNYSQKKNTSTLFQSSPIISLLNGVMNDSLTVGEVTRFGDFGLGTFNGVDGEMIVLNRKIYRVGNNGKVNLPSRNERTPFVSVTFFHAEKSFAWNQNMNMKKFIETLDEKLSSKNLIYAIKVSGKFDYMETRSESKQTKPYSNLADVLKGQSVFKFNKIDGTLVGFRFPNYMQGVNVPGYHFHFLSADKKSGGHVLDFSSGKVKIEIEAISNFEMNFPKTEEFLKADFDKKPTPGL
ncbi:MAG: acetolactate decarboxylase [Bacteroidetes bacterium]|nr:acetolactate decarboxylase [Bacteroidota bacterium]